MIGLNKIMLIGTVGRNPDTRYIGPGASFSRFSVATTENVQVSGGRTTEQTEWHEVVAFRELSEYAAQYIKKGDTIYAEGRLKSRYISDGPESGHRIYEVMAERILILQRSRANSAAPIPDGGPDTASDTASIGCGLPGFDIENIPGNLKGDADGLPF